MLKSSNIESEVSCSREHDTWGMLAFLFGLAFVQGIFYVAKVGNLYVDVIYPVSIVVLCLNFALRPKKTMDSLESCFYRGLIPFLIIVTLSVFLAIGSTMTHVGVQISSCVNGLVVLLFSLIIYGAVIAMRDRMQQFVWGLFFGLLMNIVISFIQYMAFQSGTAFTLYDLFPQPAFYISVPWGAGSAWAQNIEYLVYSFRAQGLYLEVSYFVGAATIVFILAMGEIKENGIVKGLALSALLFLFVISNTGNISLFVAFVLLTYIVVRSHRGETSSFFSKRRSSKEWLALLLVVVALAEVCLYAIANNDEVLKALDFDNLVKGLFGGLESSDITSSDNQQRFQYMQNAFEEFVCYPWGGGYNMAPTLTFCDYGTNATFSYILTLLVELGPLGLVAYVYLVLGMAVRLFKQRKNGSLFGVCVAVALVALLAFQTGNGIGLTPLAWCVFALASIEIAERKGDGNGYCLED